MMFWIVLYMRSQMRELQEFISHVFSYKQTTEVINLETAAAAGVI